MINPETPLATVEALDALPMHGMPLPPDARELAIRLAASGMRYDPLMLALLAAYPGDRFGFASYSNLATEAIHSARPARSYDNVRHVYGAHTPSPAHFAAHPRASPPAMSPGVLAFAEAHDFICAYCGRRGSIVADPQGDAWHRDHVPNQRANNLVLSCSACKLKPDRRVGAMLHERP